MGVRLEIFKMREREQFIKAQIFGDVNQRVSGILAFVIAFFVSAYSGPALASFFTSIFAGTSIIIAGILSIILFAVLLGFSQDDLKAGKYGLWAVLIIGVLLFVASAGGDFLGIRLGSSAWTTILILVLLAVAVAFISGGVGGKETTTPPTPAAGK